MTSALNATLIAQLLEQRLECAAQAPPLLGRQPRGAVADDAAPHEAPAGVDRCLQIRLVEDSQALLANVGAFDLAQPLKRGIEHRPLDLGGGALRAQKLRHGSADLL